MTPLFYFASRRAAIAAANQATRQTEQQHEPYYQGGWLVRNQVTKRVTDARGLVIVGTV